MKILIEFSLENPQGGVQFVLPPEGATQDGMVSVTTNNHIFCMRECIYMYMCFCTRSYSLLCLMLQQHAHVFTYGWENSSRLVTCTVHVPGEFTVDILSPHLCVVNACSSVSSTSLSVNKPIK